MQKTVKWIAAALIVAVGCRPSEPPPTMYEDLGAEDRALLPTSAGWHDASVAKGTSDWPPFRKPDLTAKPASSDEAAKTAPADGRLAEEIASAVNDFNGVVAEGKFDEIADYLVEEQAEAAKQVVEVFPQFAAKLGELAAVLPGENETLKKVATTLTLAKVLTLEVTDVKAAGGTQAVGKAGEGEVRFTLVKEEEGDFWYIDHPVIRGMGAAMPAMQQSLQQIDALVAGIKSGQITQEAAAQQAAAMDKMLSALIPSAQSPANDAEPEETPETAEDAAEDKGNNG